MKNFIKNFKYLSQLLLVLLFISSCNDEEISINDTEQLVFDKHNIENAPLDAQIKYANKHLLNIGEQVLNYYKTPEFKSFLSDEITKSGRADTHYSFLVKNLISNVNTKKLGAENSKEKIEKSLEAFYNLDGQDWHPEIIIYNFEEK